MNQRYDYIIIGAGSAGCVLANRLSEDPDKEVLLSRLQEDGNYKIFRIPLDEKNSSFKLQVSDYISLSLREQDLERKKIKVIGAVSNPGNFKYSSGMTLDDALKM